MISATLTMSPAAPNHGDVVTATYAVSGNDGTPTGPSQVESILGKVTIGQDVLDVVTTLTLPGAPAVAPLPVVYVAPTAAGLTFVATADPAVFTALVP